MIRYNWKKLIIGTLDVCIAIYLLFAMTSFSKKGQDKSPCVKTNVYIADSSENGFLDGKEIKNILSEHGLLPEGKPMCNVNPRTIESLLTTSGPFVKNAQCFKTQDKHVNIIITQRMPLLRIKSNNGNDYYIDDNGSPLPNSKYTSDMIVATGNINHWYAKNYLAPLAKAIMSNDFWESQIEQINVLPDRGIELVPRVGNNILFLGYLTSAKSSRAARLQDIVSTTSHKLDRLEKFYRYGLSQAGWNKYSYISVEFDNQIICKRKQ